MNKQANHNHNHEVDDLVHGNDPSTWVDRMKMLTSLPDLLRVLGACAVLASMSLFLLNGWAEGNDIQRYLKLLAQTGLLTAAGIALTAGLKEVKGARLFFGLSLVSVVANFTILGALVYSIVQWDNALQSYPAALTWQGADWLTFMPVFAGAVVLLSVLSRFSFQVFARSHAASLWPAFLLLCFTLLIPVRDSLSISIVIAAAAWVAYKVSQRIISDSSFVRTGEARFALAILFLPAVIMLARAVSLYHVNSVLGITLSGLALVALRAFSLADRVREAKTQSALHGLAGIAQFLLALNIAVLSANLMPTSLDVLPMAGFTLVFAGLTAEFVFSARQVTSKRHYLNWAISVLLISNVAFALFDHDIAFKLFALMASAFCWMLALICAKQFGGRFAVSASFMATVVSAGLLVHHVIRVLQLNNWVIIGLVGGALIVVASVHERFSLRVKNQMLAD